MIIQLQPREDILPLDYDIVLRAPGLSGSLEIFPARATAGGLRLDGEAPLTLDLEKALLEQNVEFMESLEFSVDQEFATEGTRSGAGETIEIDVPAPSADYGQFVLAVDEVGGINWCFAETAASEVDGGTSPQLRGTSRYTYRIPRDFPSNAGEEPSQTRGLAQILGKKLIQILLFPIADAVLGRIGVEFACQFEKSRFPYRIRRFEPETYQSGDVPDFTAEDWERLRGGRALLLVHGTFSRAHKAFGGLSLETVEELNRRYCGRVFAFDHFTLSDDPIENVKYFVSQIPKGIQLNLDILCHSRGGLVSRVLAERQSELALGNRQIRVHRIVFVGVPNDGTVMSDGDYLGEFLNYYTNLLNLFPDNGLTETLDVLITIAKMLAVGAMKGLDGLKSMQPGGDFLQKLNNGSKPPCEYFALAADFEPKEALEWPRNYLTDRFFKGKENDLVVPTDGVYQVENCPAFPIGENCRFIFEKEAGVQHTTFFQSLEAQNRLLDWLPGTSPVPGKNNATTPGLT